MIFIEIEIGELTLKYENIQSAIEAGERKGIPFAIKSIVSTKKRNIKAPDAYRSLSNHILISKDFWDYLSEKITKKGLKKFLKNGVETLSLQEHIEIKKNINQFKEENKSLKSKWNCILINPTDAKETPYCLLDPNKCMSKETILEFLNWLDYWLDYAINNCDVPAIKIA